MRTASFSQQLVILSSKIKDGSIIKIDNKYYKVKELG